MNITIVMRKILNPNDFVKLYASKIGKKTKSNFHIFLFCSKHLFIFTYSSATSWVLIHHLYVVHIETWCYQQGYEHNSIIKTWRHEGHPAIGNKHKTDRSFEMSFDI